MAEVMPGDIRADGVAVGEAQNHLEPAVHLFVFENSLFGGTHAHIGDICG